MFASSSGIKGYGGRKDMPCKLETKGEQNGIRESRKPEKCKRDENAKTKDSNSRESFRPSTSRRTPNLNQTRTSENSSSELTRFIKRKKRRERKVGERLPYIQVSLVPRHRPSPQDPFHPLTNYRHPHPFSPACETLKGKLTT